MVAVLIERGAVAVLAASQPREKRKNSRQNKTPAAKRGATSMVLGRGPDRERVQQKE